MAQDGAGLLRIALGWSLGSLGGRIPGRSSGGQQQLKCRRKAAPQSATVTPKTEVRKEEVPLHPDRVNRDLYHQPGG
jgi:hypothetical protein